MIIDKPGIYRGVVPSDYHEDPCPSPSLSQSVAKILLDQSPLHAWIAHPRLNPDFEPDNATKFDLGNTAHRLMLGRGRDLEILPYDDWRKKEAQAEREAAHEAGKIAVLQHQFDQAQVMTDTGMLQLNKHEASDAFGLAIPGLGGGAAEVMLAWQEDGIWFRSLVDWLHDDLCTVDDYKTSDYSLAPHVLGNRAESAGWHIQAAFIERGLDVLDPENKGRRKFRFVAQETAVPHALSVMQMDEHWLTMGRKQVDAAIGIWRRCLAQNRWPSYPPKVIVPQYPGYREAVWLDREGSGEFDPTLVMAG